MPRKFLLISLTVSNLFLRKSRNTTKKCGSVILLLKDSLPRVEEGDACVLITPSIKRDYDNARKIVLDGAASVVMLRNGLVEDTKSVPLSSTMTSFLKPLIYNS